ncbi:MAG: magnesium/cobalt transporter CorA, partial [Vicinamibacterales bacterium]
AIDPDWLDPENGATLWVDLASPTDAEARLLSESFHFHELAVEDALSEIHNPKVEDYPGFLYLALHGIDFEASKHAFATHEVDFFLGPNFLVTVHDSTSRSIERWRTACPKNAHLLAEGAGALMHRIVDVMVDNYEPEIEKIETRLEELETEVFQRPRGHVIREILAVKRDISTLRRVTTPQRDVIGRLARREFPLISDTVSYRFRDVYDHLVRYSDEALTMLDRVSGLLDAHLSTVSNRLNEVMKVLTIISVIFMPLSVLTGLYGMNVPLPHLPGGEQAQFWWVIFFIGATAVTMLAFFRRKGWW